MASSLIRQSSSASFAMFCLGAALFGGMILLPLYWQGVRHESVVDTGLLTAPQGLGMALVMPLAGKLTDRLDRCVEVDEAGVVTRGHAPPDRGEAVPAAAQQHVAAMVEKRLQRLLQVHHPRHARGIDDVEVERHPDFQFGQPEQLLHQNFGIDIAGLGLEDEAHLLGRFVADIGEQRQLLFFEQCRDLCKPTPGSRRQGEREAQDRATRGDDEQGRLHGGRACGHRREKASRTAPASRWRQTRPARASAVRW